MPARKGGITYALGRELPVISGEDETIRGYGVARRIIVVTAGVKAIDPAVFLRQATVPIEPQAAGQAEVRAELEFVLNVLARLIGTVVAAGVALKESGGLENEVGGWNSLQKLRKVR